MVPRLGCLCVQSEYGVESVRYLLPYPLFMIIKNKTNNLKEGYFCECVAQLIAFLKMKKMKGFCFLLLLLPWPALL